MTDLSGKVAIVAGAGGIGGASARLLAQRGCGVVVADLSRDTAQAVASEISKEGGRAFSIQFDQADASAVTRLIRVAVETFGRLDFVHDNAADMVALRSDTGALTIGLDVFDRTMDVNLRGNVVLAQAALPQIVANEGAFVFTSSGAAYAGEPTRLAYAISKSGINALVRHIASRWGARRCSCKRNLSRSRHDRLNRFEHDRRLG